MAPPSCRPWYPSDAVDAVQDVGEEVSRDCDLGQMESDVAAVADYLRADLHELLAQRRERPVPHLLGQR